MAVRSGVPNKSFNELTDLYDKYLERIYLTWLSGVLTGVIGITQKSVSVGGVNLAIEKPDTIQGIIYLVTIFYTIRAVMFMVQPLMLSRRPMLRWIIHMQLPKGRRSLEIFDSNIREFVRNRTSSWITGGTILSVCIAMFPSIIIIAFNWRSLLSAVQAIF